MKYMALIYASEELSPVYGSPEWGPFMQRWTDFHGVMAKDGIEFSGEPLQRVETATTVRVRDNKTQTMDGPFAETKEQLGGFYLLDCKDLDEAIKYAAMIPTADYGTVEVRPVMSLG